MFLPQTDLTLPGTLPLIVQRRHGSLYRRGRWFGVTWSSTLDQRVEVDEDGIHFAAADGRVLHYPVPSVHGQQVMPSYGPRWPLAWNRKDDVITIEQGDAGCVLHFPAGPVPEVCRPLATVSDQAGNRITFVHDAEGVPTDVYHSGGYHLSVQTIETRGGTRVSALRLADPQGGPDVTVRSYRYDMAGRLTEVVNSSGVPLALEYDEADRVTAWTDRNGYTYRYEYRGDGRVVRAGGDDGRLKVELDYDLQARTTTMTDALGHATVYHWNELLHTVKVVDPLGHTTTSELDRYGQLLAATDPLGRTTLIERDGFGDALRVQWPDGSVLTTRYDERRRPIETVQPDGARWSYTYGRPALYQASTGRKGYRPTISATKKAGSPATATRWVTPRRSAAIRPACPWRSPTRSAP
jgi:YD repeat-containing protein